MKYVEEIIYLLLANNQYNGSKILVGQHQLGPYESTVYQAPFHAAKNTMFRFIPQQMVFWGSCYFNEKRNLPQHH